MTHVTSPTGGLRTPNDVRGTGQIVHNHLMTETIGRFDKHRRERILEAATHLIAERGVNNVRVADIAKRVGTTSGTVHYHFEFKDDLLNSAINWAVAEAFERQSRLLEGIITPKEKLLQILEIQLPNDQQSRHEWSIWLQYWNEASRRPELRETHVALNAQWRAGLVEIVEEGIREGDFKPVNAKEFVDHMQALFNGLGIEVLVGSSSLEHMRTTMVTFLKSSLFA